MDTGKEQSPSARRYRAVELRKALIMEDTCPECLGELDTDRECNDCGYDAFEEIQEYERGEG